MITSYEQMPVGVYCKMREAMREDAEDARLVGLVAALAGMPRDAVLDEPLADFTEQVSRASFVLEYPRAAAVRKEYELRGRKYKATLRREDITAGQFIDWQELAKREGAEDSWAEFLSVILVPVGHRYGEGYDIGEVQEAIRAELCILDAVALRAFFLVASGPSLTSSLRCLAAMMRKMGSRKAARREYKRVIREARKDLAASGGGFPALMRWLRLPDAIGTR